MQLQYHTHNLTIDETAPQVRETVWQLRRVLLDLPYLFWPEKSEKLLANTPLSVQKETQLKSQESLQSLYNIWLRQALQEQGFEAECRVRDPRTSPNKQKSDFAKLVEDARRVFIEVEFGYTASIERNLFKFTDAHHHGRSALGILVCPVAALAKVTASGVATFETARERLQSFHPATLPVPLLVLGLDHTDATRIDLSRSRLPGPACLSGNNSKQILWHVASELRAGVCVEDIGPPSALEACVVRRELKARTTVTDGQSLLWA